MLLQSATVNICSFHINITEVKAVLHVRIRIQVFLGLLDPDPDPLVRGMDPDPSIIIV
jgi:hypothetical protein